MLRIIIAGGRDFNDIEKLEKLLLRITENYDAEEITIVSGGANGADKLGEILARKYLTNLAIYPAQWEKYGKSAGYKRNQLMAENADTLLVCWDGKSKGTKHMLDIARKANLPIHILNY